KALASTRGFQRARKAGRRRLSTALAMAYACSVLLPHLASVTHVHEGGGAAHAHVAMSAHDVALERAVLALGPQGQPRRAPANPARAHGTRAHSSAKDAGDETLADASARERPGDERGSRVRDADLAAHTHGADDPNLPALGAAVGAPPGAFAPVANVAAVPAYVPALAILAS